MNPLAVCRLGVSSLILLLRTSGVLIALFASLLCASGVVHAMLAAPAIYPYELAYQEAAIIVQGDIVSCDIGQGAVLRVKEVVRGDARTGAEYLLVGSAGYSFLTALPRDTTAFVSTREGKTLHLLQGPTSGGLIWSEPGLLQTIARAHADPRASLRSKAPRERLAGAYFLATGLADTAKPSSDEYDAMLDSIAWGMSHGSPSTNQAAVETLAALGYTLEKIGISYHPGYRPEFKHEAAVQLRAWWAKRGN